MVSTVHIFSKDIRIEFGIKKCGVLLMRREKAVLSEGVEMYGSEKIEEVRKTYIRYFRTQQNQKKVRGRRTFGENI